MKSENDNRRVSAVILAAGESKRMGSENKLLLPLRDKPLLLHVVDAVCRSSADECVIVVGHEAGVVEAALAGHPLRIVENAAYREGMSTSIHAGVKAAADGAAGYMICLSDMPAIETPEYDELLSVFRERLEEDAAAIVVPTFDGRRGNPVLISSAYKPAILAHQGVVGCRSIVKDNPDHVYRHPMQSDHVLRDVDTPDALAEVERWI